MKLQHNLSPSSLLLISLLTFLFLLSAAAQDLPTIATTTDTEASTGTTAATSNTASDTGTNSNTKSSNTKTTDDSSATSDLPAISTKTSAAASSTTTESAPPRISSSDDGSTDAGLPTGLPQLPGGFKYPAPSVPPTANAPYMQKSNLPEGTVFIAVGAALGFFGLIILAWRGLVAWSINRSVKRAAVKQSHQAYGIGDSKSLLRNHKPSPYTDGPGSTMSLEKLSSHHKTSTSKSQTTNSSLFFSPTAGAGMQTSHRNSGYLPAGYYAAGASVPGGGSGMTYLGETRPVSMRPTSQGYMRPRSMGPSPPVSPSLPPSRGADAAYPGNSGVGVSTHPSTSTLNLSAPPQGRAPSAYLEDLFENYPPGQIRPSMERRQ